MFQGASVILKYSRTMFRGSSTMIQRSRLNNSASCPIVEISSAIAEVPSKQQPAQALKKKLNLSNKKPSIVLCDRRSAI
jgi:hypothetical protein